MALYPVIGWLTFLLTSLMVLVFEFLVLIYRYNFTQVHAFFCCENLINLDDTHVGY